VDHLRLMELSNKALTFAKKVLRPGGHFICKASTGGEEPLFKKRLQKLFEEVKFIKPDSSFKDSTEIFVVALNYQKITRPPETQDATDSLSEHPIDDVTPAAKVMEQEPVPIEAPAPTPPPASAPPPPPTEKKIPAPPKDKKIPPSPKRRLQAGAKKVIAVKPKAAKPVVKKPKKPTAKKLPSKH
jgi:hypothetical protein